MSDVADVIEVDPEHSDGICTVIEGFKFYMSSAHPF